MSKSYSIARARDQLAELVHRAEAGTAVELTRHGKPVAVILSKQAYEALARPRPGLWDAVEEFRRAHDLESAGFDDDVFDSLRDRSPGRKVKL